MSDHGAECILVSPFVVCAVPKILDPLTIIPRAPFTALPCIDLGAGHSIANFRLVGMELTIILVPHHCSAPGGPPWSTHYFMR